MMARNSYLAQVDKSRGAVKRPFNGFVNGMTKEKARKELSKLKTHERAYIFLANGKVRRIDGNERKVWMDWRLNHEGAYMIHNHIYSWDMRLSSYDKREAEELKLEATEVICGNSGEVYIP